MATITVQAGSALHLLGGQNDGPGGRDENLRAALTAIRETSKAALGEMRTVVDVGTRRLSGWRPRPPP